MSGLPKPEGWDWTCGNLSLGDCDAVAAEHGNAIEAVMICAKQARTADGKVPLFNIPPAVALGIVLSLKSEYPMVFASNLQNVTRKSAG